MKTAIKECLSGEHGSYILPFLWLHGESHQRLREEIIAIRNSGIREFCAESRPYEQFCREQWWCDFAFILETAKELGMRVWLLDDKKFPTGYANGYLEDPAHAHLRKRQIRERQSEAVGPMKRAKLHVGGWLSKPCERIVSVVAYRHADAGEGLDFSTATDLTHCICDGMVTWDVPDGVWRVCVMIETDSGFAPDHRMAYYIDMLNPDSCRAMIEAVYEPHYAHFGSYFGNTFAGFFSDEPGFLNRTGSYHNRLGIMYESYPWRADLPALIAESAGMDEASVRLAMPALWEDLGEVTAAIRMHYMEVVTKLYRQNFGNMLGDWCRDHGVMYIGHVIEDMGAHLRLGYGSGHFFRALDGQDMAGIDVVLMQDIPGVSSCVHRAKLADGGTADPTFFRYTMPKMAASHAHIQPLKQGRAMCEIFGAFGWAAGLPYMKGLADIMLASGINHFVPHAFSPKEEDPDCPPHFYNGGRNVQYPLFKNLMDYMGRCSHVLKGGLHRADVAVFYNAEGEWTGGENQLFHHVCRTLTTNLIDFDVIPYDTLCGASVAEKALEINGERYGALIVSASEILPRDRLDCFARLAGAGLPVIFTDRLPAAVAEGDDVKAFLTDVETVPTCRLAEDLRTRGLCHVSGKGQGLSELRFYHVSKGRADCYLFSNEAIRHGVDAWLTLPQQGEFLIYDPWENRCYRGETGQDGLHLLIEKGNMLFVIFGCDIPEGAPPFRAECQRHAIAPHFDISLREEGATAFKCIATDSPLFDISADDRDPHFSGEVLYETTLTVPDGFTVLDLGEVGEVAEAWLNGVYLGARINAPYKFNLKKALHGGENRLRVLVKGNLGHRRRDSLSKFIQLPPTGILGELALCRYSNLYTEKQ